VRRLLSDHLFSRGASLPYTCAISRFSPERTLYTCSRPSSVSCTSASVGVPFPLFVPAPCTGTEGGPWRPEEKRWLEIKRGGKIPKQFSGTLFSAG
jgi:hypothetical protein